MELEPRARFGRYEAIRRLGRGGTGEVWEAVLHGPQGFRKPVALKLLRAERVEPAQVRALTEEARLGALLAHPNVVVTFDLGAVDGRWYVAMELVRGASLSEIVHHGPLPGRAVVEAGLQACAGLGAIHALHESGAPVVHRDIKPSNLLVDRTGMLKVADLGLAGLSGTGDRRGGTPGYTPPEQVEGREDPRADLFALGATLYQLATGLPPFGAGAPGFIATRQAERRGAALVRSANAAVPGLGDVLRRCLRSDPADRFATAREMAFALATVRTEGGSLRETLGRSRPGLVPAGPTVPIPSTAAVPGNLPAERDRFVGREAEIRALTDLAGGGERLVALVGPGGMGKTRLAVAAARRMGGQAPGGTWFADLSEARSVEGACYAVASALGIPLAGADPVAHLGQVIRGRGRCVLVLDNLEQLADHLSATVAVWRDLAPEATLLCTSRVHLRLVGERAVALEALPRPDGVALFVERAPRTLAPEEQAEVAALVDDLEGMPLAIELAAARALGLPVREIRHRLGDRLRLLAGGDGDRPPRMASVRASLDASWELLSPDGRSALAQLSVFEGGFTLGAAEAILDVAGWAVDVLQELVEASLLRPVPATERFRMLVVVQQHAAEHLVDPDRARRRHAAHFASWGTADALRTLDAHGGVERRMALGAEVENLVAACRAAVALGEPSWAAACARAAWEVLIVRGPFAVGASLAEGALSLPTLDPHLRAHLHAVAGDAWSRAGHLELGRTHLEAALDGFAVAGDRQGRGLTLGHLGLLEQNLGHIDAASARLGDALDESRAAGDLRTEGVVLGMLGNVLLGRGEMERARGCYERAIRIHGELGNRRSEGIVVGNLGALHARQGRMQASRDHFGAALAIHREVGNHRDEGLVLNNLAAISLDVGRRAEARHQYEEALLIAREVGNRRFEGIVHGGLANLEREEERLDRARVHYETALAIHCELDDRLEQGVVLGNLGNLDMDEERHDLARDRYEAALALHRETGSRPSEGRVLANLGHLCAMEGRTPEATEHYDRALAIHRSVGDRHFEGLVLGYLGALHRTAGRPTDARAALAEAERLLREVDDPRKLLTVHCEQARLALDEGRAEDARAAVDAAVAMVDRMGQWSTRLGAEVVALRQRVG